MVTLQTGGTATGEGRRRLVGSETVRFVVSCVEKERIKVPGRNGACREEQEQGLLEI